MPTNTDRVNLSDARYIATRELNKREVYNDRSGGRWNGFSDPNPSFSPYDLYGSTYRTAIYDEMSKASPVIAQALRQMADAISSMSIKIEPSGDSPKHQIAAARCEDVLTNMGNQSLKAWIWDVVYHTVINGHSLFEVVVTEDDVLDLYRVRSNTIQSFISDDGLFVGTNVTAEGSSVFLPAEKGILISMEDFPGNWWGTSLLRPLVSTYQMYKTSVLNFLAGQRNSKGFLSIQENGEATQEDWYAIQSFLTDYYNDVESPLILSRQFDVEFVTTSNMALQEIKEMYDKYENTIREYLFDSVNNLGEHGSRALGSEFRVSDSQKFARFVSTWEDLLNGKGGDHASILMTILEYSGFDDPSLCPVFRIEDNSEQDIDAQVNSIKTLVDAGIVTRDDLGDETVARIIQQIGYQPLGLLE